MQEGFSEYSDLDWGPQPVRYLWLPAHPGTPFGVRGDSGINTFADLKGRTVAIFPGSPGATNTQQAILAFGGLTWDDVVPKEYPHPGAAYGAVITGKLDTTFFNVSSSKSYEAAALPCGWHYLNMPATDTKGWARLKALSPTHSGRVSTIGGGLSAENPIETLTQAYPCLIT